MTSTSAADFRSHVRHDSIAQKRNTPSKPKPKPTASSSPFAGTGRGGEPPRGDNAGGLTRGSSSPDGQSGFTMTPSRAIKTAVVALVLFAILHFYPSATSNIGSRLSDAETITHDERKSRMEGSGEAWILPKRWRDDSPVLGGETLPDCRRVMLFRFSDSHGFSSEVLHYLRALVIGQKLGYTVLADDSRWNYGSLSEYFLPRLVHCRPPSDWFDPSQAVKLGSKRWQSQDRVWVSRDMERDMDLWLREEMLDPATTGELKNRKMGTILPEGETLPAPLEEVYTDFSAVLKEVWRPNHQLAVLIRKQRMELGLGGGGLRHRKNSPNWGGRQRKGVSPADQDIIAEEEEFEQEYELHVAERSDRGPVVGVHLTTPKPALPLDWYGLSVEAKTGNLSAVFEGSSDAVKRLSRKSSIENPGYSRSRPTLFPPSSTTTLVALTSSNKLFDEFEREATKNKPTVDQLFNLVRTSPLDQEELTHRWSRVFSSEGAKTNSRSILEEWDQKIWNSELPRPLKVELTRYFVRDLTTLSRFADAFIVSGASPTGVLSILLAGEEGAVGPRDFEGGSFGGRVRSIDGFWVPTSSVKTLYG